MWMSAEREFSDDVRHRKSLVPSARRRKCGSKSRYCGLPSDHLTAKQWKERNGAVMIYNTRKPMTWKEFKKMPTDLQKQYLLWLSFTFRVSRAALADMFECAPKTVDRFLEEHNIDMGFARGRKMTEEQHAAFNRFRYGIPEPDEAESATAEPDAAPANDSDRSAEEGVRPMGSDYPAPKTGAPHVHELNLMLDGYVGDDLVRKILRAADSVFHEGTPVRVGLRITTVEEREVDERV